MNTEQDPFGPFGENDAEPARAYLDGQSVEVGSHVVIHPKRHHDIFDVVLENKAATVESIQEDFEGNAKLATGSFLNSMRFGGRE
jgi:hypothetical protein